MNIFDYLNWRDDIDFDEINELDVLIFNRLSYFPLEKIMYREESITIKKAYDRILKFGKAKYANDNDEKLFEILSKSNRYKDLIINNIINKFNKEKEEQFMAITINLPNNSIYVSFRGTMSDIVGWKEDFNMTFMSEVPAQNDALEYVDNIIIFDRMKIYLGGHSKGGNLAMYAGIHANKSLKDQIVRIYNYDGPGFMKLDVDYYNMKNKIVTYIPTSSIVGRLLNADNEVIVVKSKSKGIFQHDLYSWNVQKKYLIRDNLSEEGNVIKRVIDDWTMKATPNELKELVNSVYNMIEESGIEDIKQLKISDLKNILLSYKNMNNETKKTLSQVISLLFESTKENINYNIKNKINE